MRLNVKFFIYKNLWKIFYYELLALEVAIPLTCLARSLPLLLFELFEVKPLQAININVNFY